MKVLVTGATGFIGQFVVERLLNLGHEVIATGRKCLAEVKKISLFSEVNYISKNLNHIENNYHDFFNNPDALIHLSWEGLPNYRALFHIEKNLYSNYNFIKNMAEHGLNNITIVGTCFEYGLQNGCLHENMVIKPVTSYGLAKDCLRRFVESLQETYQFSYKWVRLFYPFGPGQGEKSLFGQMTNVISKKSKEFNMSMGEQIRDYLPVETMAKYIVAISVQNKIDGVINCCSGKPISVRTFVENFFEQHDYPVKLNLGVYPYPDYEPLAFWGDTGKLELIIENL